VTLDDVVVGGLPVPAWLRQVAVQHAVQLQDRAFGERHVPAALMDQTEGIAVAHHLLLGTAVRRSIPEHQRLEPMCRDDHALQAVRRPGRLDHGHLPEIAQDPRRLRHEELLLSPILTKGAQGRQLLRVEAQCGEVVWRE